MSVGTNRSIWKIGEEMRAVICKEWGPPEKLVICELPLPEYGDEEVLVDVVACGISFPDLLTIQGRYQVKPELPFCPGGDIAGVVIAVGANVPSFRVGDKVVGRGKSGVAEFVVADWKRLHRLPDGVEYVVAAAFGRSYGTSLFALSTRGRVKAGETLVVLGASGGVGLAAVELGKALGATVIACASTQEKLETCKKMGAHRTICYSSMDLREAIQYCTAKQGVDVVFDPVGDRFSEPAFRELKWGGRYLVVGFAGGEIPRLPLNLPLLKGSSIVGVSWGGLNTIQPSVGKQLSAELLDMVAECRIKPFVSRSYSLETTVNAFRDLMDRKVRGNIAIDLKM